jgi:hypothetical protein
MERVLVRTCSADQASVLARAAGRFARVGAARVRIYPPAGREPIHPSNPDRYLARIEILDPDDCPNGPAGKDAADVVSGLFGPYLN